MGKGREIFSHARSKQKAICSVIEQEIFTGVIDAGSH
jgi:hypothetical protein